MGREAAATRPPKLRRGLWSPEEDEKLYNHIIRYGVGCWSSVPKLAGLERCGKSCRLRWINYLRPDLKRGSFSQQEEDLIVSLHKILGNRWSQIASQLPGRTDNEIKNFWNSCIKKKLRQQGIDPATHKPLNDDNVAAAAAADNNDTALAPHHCAASNIDNNNNNNNNNKRQLPSADDHCFAMSSDDPLAPHSPTASFDPLSVTNVPTAMQQGSYGSFRSDNDHLCDYGGGGGDSSSNSNGNGTWACSGGEPMPPHVAMFGRDAAEAAAYQFVDPAKYSPWQQDPAARLHDHNVGGAAAGFPIRSMSRDLPGSCFDLARSALEDEFSVDFL